MVRKAILVGTGEKHSIEVDVSQWTGRARVTVDGKEAASDFVFTSKVFNLVVGVSEKHTISVKIGGVVTPVIEFYIDQVPMTSATEASKNAKRSIAAWIGLIAITIIAFIAGYLFMQYLLTSLFG